jgi:hypothetical protein
MEHKEILDPIIDEFKKISFDFWVNHLDFPITFEGSKAGQEYQIEILSTSYSSEAECVMLIFAVAFDDWSHSKDYPFYLYKSGKLSLN